MWWKAAHRDRYVPREAVLDALIDPDDLVEALRKHGATGGWQSAAPSYRRNILLWIAAAKRPETRQARITKVATLAAQGQKVPQY